MIRDTVSLPPNQIQIYGQFDENNADTYNRDMMVVFAKKGNLVALPPIESTMTRLTSSWSYNGYHYDIDLNQKIKIVIDIENKSTNPTNESYVVIDFKKTNNTVVNQFTSKKILPGQRQKFIITIHNDINTRIRFTNEAYWLTYVDYLNFFINQIRVYIHTRNLNGQNDPREPTIHTNNAFVIQSSLRSQLAELTGVCLNQKLLLDSFLQSKWKPQGTSFPGTSIRVTKGIGVIKNMMFETINEATMNMMQPRHFHEYLINGELPSPPEPNEFIYVVARYNNTLYPDNVSSGVAIAFCRPDTYDKIDDPEQEGWMLLNVIEMDDTGQITSDNQITEEHIYNGRLNYRPTIPMKTTSELNGGVVNIGGSWLETWV